MFVLEARFIHITGVSMSKTRSRSYRTLFRFAVQATLIWMLLVSAVLATALPTSSAPSATGFSNVSIDAGSTLSNVTKSGSNPVTYSPDADSASIGVDDIQDELNDGNTVIIDTNNAGGNEDGDITVTVSVAKTSGSDADLSLQANNDVIINNSISLTNIGAGQISIKAKRRIFLDTDAGITTVDGAITLEANIAGSSSGTFEGIELDSADITSTNGDISLTGHGGDSGPGNKGVWLRSGPTIESTGTGTIAATITINGTGGNGTDTNIGVLISGPNSEIKSVDGDVLIGGQGGNGTGPDNYGVRMESCLVESTGTGADAANITIDGTGGDGLSSNVGTFHSIGSKLSAVDGDIAITGQGQGRGTSNHGIEIFISEIKTTGDGIIELSGIEGSVGDGIASLNGTITANTGSLTMTTDTIVLLGTTSLGGSGTLTIKPYKLETSIGLGNVPGTGTLFLSNSELGTFADGFSSITIGDTAAGIGLVQIAPTAAFQDPVTIVGGSIHVTGLDANGNDVTLLARTGGIEENSTGTDIIASSAILEGKVTPGGDATLGQLIIDGDGTLISTKTFSIDLDGTASDQLQILGANRAVDLADTNLAVNLLSVPPAGTVFTIIDNVDPGSDVNGTLFAGFPEASFITSGGKAFFVRYQEGIDNNDVTLTTNTAPTAGFRRPSSLNEGDQYTLRLINASDVDPPDVIAGYEYRFDCGDGSGYSPWSSGNTRTCNALDNGIRTMRGRIRDQHGAASSYSATVSVANISPSVRTILNPPQMSNEGENLTFNATFSDPGVLDTHTATIDWDDGSPVENIPVSQGTGGFGGLEGYHTYADDGGYNVQVCVTDNDNATSCTTKLVTVENVAPTVDAGPEQTVDEGETVHLAPAVFTDPGLLDTHTGTIGWDDGSALETGTVTQEAGFGSVDGFHTYLDDGIYSVDVCVTDNGSEPTGTGKLRGCDTLIVTVLNAPPAVIAGPDQDVNEGDSLTVAATYTDAGVLDTHTATVDWDDGTVTDPATVDQDLNTAYASHIYANNGNYTVGICVQDSSGGTGCDTLIVTVQNVPPTANGDTYTGDEDIPLVVDPPGVLDNDSDPGDDTMIVQLVNGPSNGTLTTPLQADGSFVYAPSLNWNGSDSFTYQAFDGIDASNVATVTLHVLPVDDPIKIVAGEDTSIGEGEEAVVSANFSDPDSSETHTATIDWGDGAIDGGAVDEGGGSGMVSGSHVYADDGTFIVIVCVNDPGTDASGGCDTLDVTVNNLPPTVDAGPDQSPNEDDMAIVSASFSDPGILDTHTATIDWDDGLGPVAVVLNEANGAGTVKGIHSYLSAGDYTVQACVMDNGGAEGCDSLLISVQPFDSDRDGLSNGDERELGTDPFNPDSDDDGLDDGEEVNGVETWNPTDPLNPDSDGDDIPDGEEVANGTDPNDPDDPPACTLPYDFNEDNIVDIDDVFIIIDQSIFGAQPYDSSYDIAPDIPDGVVDIEDIFKVSQHVGESCPVW